MREPQQPVCKGVDKKGELIWGFITMPRWQQAMFPVRYVGDFISFWMKLVDWQKVGKEADPKNPSMELYARKGLKKPAPRSGD